MITKLFLLTTVLFGSFCVNAQNWIDSVKYKPAAKFAFEKDGYIVFKNKEGCGLYERKSKTVILEAKYQFIYPVKHPDAEGIFYVINNKIGFMKFDSTKITNNARYSRYGYIYTDSKKFEILNDSINYSGGSKISYYPLIPNSEISLSIEGNFALINDFVRPLSTRKINQIENKKTHEKSIEVTPRNNSFIIDFSTFNIIQVANAAKAHIVNQKFVFLQFMNDTNSNLVFLNSVGNKLFECAFADRLKLENIKKITDIENIVEIRKNGVEDTKDVVFIKNEKAGVYNPMQMKIIVEPNKYDFLYYPSVYYGTEITIIGKKIRTDYAGDILYDEDKKCRLRSINNIEINALYYSNNGEDFIMPYDNSRTIWQKHDLDKWQLPEDKYFSVMRSENFIVIEDAALIPPDSAQPYFRILPNGTRIDSVSSTSETESTENPKLVYRPSVDLSKYNSGVYDLITKQWIVPNKFSRITKVAEGFSCIRQTFDSITFSHYDFKGKALFNFISFKTLSENEFFMQKFLGLPEKNIKISNEEKMLFSEKAISNSLIVKADNKFGAIDFNTFYVSIPIDKIFVKRNGNDFGYTLVDSTGIGQILNYGKDYIPCKYQSIFLKPELNYLILDDTLVWDFENNKAKSFIDSVNFAVNFYEGSKSPRRLFRAKLKNGNLLVNEFAYLNMLNPKGIYDGEAIPNDTSYSEKIDLKSQIATKIPLYGELFEWDKNWLAIQLNDTLSSYASSKKKYKIPVTSTTPVFIGNTILSIQKNDESYYYDFDGNILNPDSLNLTYFSHQIINIGNGYEYYLPNQKIFTEKNLIVQAVSPTGKQLIYTVEGDGKVKKFEKKHYYYYPDSKKLEPCKLELSIGKLSVFPVDDKFIIFDYNIKTKKYTCIILNNDLETVISTFKDINKFTFQAPYGYTSIPFYTIEKDKETIYFDKHFQYLVSVTPTDPVKIDLYWNRIKIKTSFKTIFMDWEGNIVRK